MTSSSFFLLLHLSLRTTYIPLSSAHNITWILADHPDFSTFNHYLSATHLAAEINCRKTITILALDNPAMFSLLAKHLHAHIDYFSAKKLHQINDGTALYSTVFQSTGFALGMAGFVNITNHWAGRVTFYAEDSDVPVAFVSSLKEIPYTIAVMQLSAVDKMAGLLYHGIPAYESLDLLRSHSV